MGWLEELLAEKDDSLEVATRLMALSILAQLHQGTDVPVPLLIRKADLLADYIEKGNRP